MIGILLTILKVIGIILLVTLGIVLALILYILLTPIVYETAGAAEKEDINLQVKVHWLLRLLRIRVSVTVDKIRLQVKVLFFVVFKKSIDWHYPLAKKPETDTDEGTVAELPVAEVPKEPHVEIKADQAESTGSIRKTKSGKKKAKPEKKTEGKPKNSSDAETSSPTVEESVEQHLEDSQAVDGASESVENVADEQSKKETPIDKLKKGWELIRREDVHKTIRLVKRTIFRILGHVLPKRGRLHGTIGTGDPASTGKILGYFYSFYPVYAPHGDFRLNGDFENKVVKGKYYLKGRIFPVYIVGCGLRLLLDKNIRRLIFHKEGKNGKQK